MYRCERPIASVEHGPSWGMYWWRSESVQEQNGKKRGHGLSRDNNCKLGGR